MNRQPVNHTFFRLLSELLFAFALLVIAIPAQAQMEALSPAERSDIATLENGSVSQRMAVLLRLYEERDNAVVPRTYTPTLIALAEDTSAAPGLRVLAASALRADLESHAQLLQVLAGSLGPAASVSRIRSAGLEMIVSIANTAAEEHSINLLPSLINVIDNVDFGTDEAGEAARKRLGEVIELLQAERKSSIIYAIYDYISKNANAFWAAAAVTAWATLMLAVFALYLFLPRAILPLDRMLGALTITFPPWAGGYSFAVRDLLFIGRLGASRRVLVSWLVVQRSAIASSLDARLYSGGHPERPLVPLFDSQGKVADIRALAQALTTGRLLRLVLRGPPGSGRSAVAAALALQIARDGHAMPVFLPFGTESGNILEWLQLAAEEHGGFAVTPVIAKRLLERGLIVIFADSPEDPNPSILQFLSRSVPGLPATAPVVLTARDARIQLGRAGEEISLGSVPRTDWAKVATHDPSGKLGEQICQVMTELVGDASDARVLFLAEAKRFCVTEGVHPEAVTLLKRCIDALLDRLVDEDPAALHRDLRALGAAVFKQETRTSSPFTTMQARDILGVEFAALRLDLLTRRLQLLVPAGPVGEGLRFDPPRFAALFAAMHDISALNGADHVASTGHLVASVDNEGGAEHVAYRRALEALEHVRGSMNQL